MAHMGQDSGNDRLMVAFVSDGALFTTAVIAQGVVQKLQGVSINSLIQLLTWHLIFRGERRVIVINDLKYMACAIWHYWAAYTSSTTIASSGSGCFACLRCCALCT